ncbi:MAG TPA: DUF4197 domain-containing protein [Prolixibacteraceae bacterium]|nr:DUF4197 domain-containing protein [Prolixibacteraceae bacterium]
MRKQISILSILSLLLLVSCDVLLQIADRALTQEKPLSADEVALGLKEALRVGVDTAVVRLSKTNGYYLDPLIKINLPPETKEVVEYAMKVPGLKDLVNDVILQINRSAEDAARQAAPVFGDAITSMTIADAWGILNGADTSATHYLREKTYDRLFGLYQPVMQKSLNKAIVGGVSAQKTWTEITSKWNAFANSIPGKILQVKPVTVSLDAWVTHQALQGLFVKVGDREKAIRTQTDARVTDLLRRVFGKT